MYGCSQWPNPSRCPQVRWPISAGSQPRARTETLSRATGSVEAPIRPTRHRSAFESGHTVVMSDRDTVGRDSRHRSATAALSSSRSRSSSNSWALPAPITVLNMFLTAPLHTSVGWSTALARLITTSASSMARLSRYWWGRGMPLGTRRPPALAKLTSSAPARSASRCSHISSGGGWVCRSRREPSSPSIGCPPQSRTRAITASMMAGWEIMLVSGVRIGPWRR